MKKLLLLLFSMHMGLAMTEQGFDVIGITTRTSNLAEMQGKGAITSLWQQFFVDQIVTKIPNKSDYTLIVLYYDFASDKNGEYSLLIGARVNSTKEVPAGMVAVHVPAEKKSVFISDEGNLQAVVMGAWQKIWAMEDAGKLKRTYKGDYELYDERSQNPDCAQVEIHIGIE